ncbi:Phosphatidylglycerol/phosphatidylinositol transfer protein [Vanrija pseudolonga]|uniref:Phosphatidylglycerol/phosphatidylinositol transfer protein n=1 Tax=Vanrija pseudolonga TaxID=143232 RepID=A0AAF1BF07_9TREE|nr:Phosphatidylglycerol/phosphatidylinositol transfer protein [Vanrija pseudolonga]
MRLAAAPLLALLSLASARFVFDDPFQGKIVPRGLPVVDGEGEVGTLSSWRWSDCGLPSDAITIESISVSPDPPEPGKNLTVTVEATANEVVEEGAYADVTVKLGLIKLLQKRFDVCEEARNANASVQCPVQPGQYTVVQTVELPEEIPKAKFVVNIRGYTVDEDDLACLDLVVDFVTTPA